MSYGTMIEQIKSMPQECLIDIEKLYPICFVSL